MLEGLLRLFLMRGLLLALFFLMGLLLGLGTGSIFTARGSLLGRCVGRCYVFLGAGEVLNL